MKKTLTCITALAAMLSAAATSYAATYDSNQNQVTTTAPVNKEAVIIIAGEASDTPTESNIVYLNQADTSFSGSVDFLIKSSPADGVYTIMFGGDDGVSSETFRIGMNEKAGDVVMTAIEGENGVAAVTDDQGKTTYNIGYTATAKLGNYNSIIIKTADGTYMGCSLPTPNMEGDGATTLGIQINGVESTSDIETVWLSTRTVDDSTGSAAAAE